jgi:uncharacterized protein YggU (UPF0235/DUF167 family)
VSRLSVKVIPKASSTRIVGWLGEALKVAVTAAPQGGRANAAVCELLASSLGVAVSRVRCISGHASSRKLLEIDELTETEVAARLNRLAAGPEAPSPES